MANVSRKVSSKDRRIKPPPADLKDYHRTSTTTTTTTGGSNSTGWKVCKGVGLESSAAAARDKRSRRLPLTEVDEDETEEDAGFPVIAASEGPIIVTFGAIQLLCGLLMSTFGVLTLLHDASLSSIGAGIWGGAMASANGIVGILAGFRGCYQKTDHVNPLIVTVYLALCLVSIAVANLALVLTATGLLRDSQRPIYFVPLRSDDGINSVNSAISSMDIEEQLRPNWAPILTNLGLLLITSVECLVTITAAFRCYWYVSQCRRDALQCHRSSSSGKRVIDGIAYIDSRFKNNKKSIGVPCTDITSTSYCSTSSSGKQKLVRQWLGQQDQHPQRHQSLTRSSVPFYPPTPPPLPPPPPPNCCLPPPYYTIDRNNKPRYPSGSYASCYSDYNNYTTTTNKTTPSHSAARSKSRYYCYPSSKESVRPLQNYENEESTADDNNNNNNNKYTTEGRRKLKERPRKISIESVYVEADIDKSYTGMDREIAEEFISVVMEPKYSLR